MNEAAANLQSAPRMKIYAFFAVHMLAFGASSFAMAYAASRPDLLFIYAHGGLAIVVYLAFYVSLFRRDEVKWMLINAALGVVGIYAQLGWILARFGRDIHSYPWYVHITPFLYYVLYTFLLRQFLIDVAGARDDAARRKLVNTFYVAVSSVTYGWLLLR